MRKGDVETHVGEGWECEQKAWWTVLLLVNTLLAMVWGRKGWESCELWPCSPPRLPPALGRKGLVVAWGMECDWGQRRVARSRWWRSELGSVLGPHGRALCPSWFGQFC